MLISYNTMISYNKFNGSKSADKYKVSGGYLIMNYLYENSGNCFYSKRCVRVCNINLIEILQFAIHNKKKEI